MLPLRLTGRGALTQTPQVPDLLSVTRKLRREMAGLEFSDPVAHVYNPLEYAWKAHAQYLERYGREPKRNLWLGMNPGPFGMAQTGVPFGEIAAVRDFLGIHAPIDRPAHEHPKRPVLGFDCPRSEVSGKRLWGWVAERFVRPEAFFAANFVYNYCPLLFLADTGRNLTPDKLASAETSVMFAACDRALLASLKALRVERVIAVGTFAEGRVKPLAAELGLELARVPHPSPASPVANRGWSAAIEAALDRQNLQSCLDG